MRNNFFRFPISISKLHAFISVFYSISRIIAWLSFSNYFTSVHERVLLALRREKKRGQGQKEKKSSILVREGGIQSIQISYSTFHSFSFSLVGVEVWFNKEQ